MPDKDKYKTKHIHYYHTSFMEYTENPGLLQAQVFRVGQVNEPCIGLTQENSIENSI